MGENDIMYPKCINGERSLVFYCKYCGETVDARPDEYCILKMEFIPSIEKEKILTNLLPDSTLPVTNSVECPNCGVFSSVYKAQTNLKGMFVQYQCIKCHNIWTKKDA